jgi:hypothetical protein
MLIIDQKARLRGKDPGTEIPVLIPVFNPPFVKAVVGNPTPKGVELIPVEIPVDKPVGSPVENAPPIGDPPIAAPPIPNDVGGVLKPIGPEVAVVV